MVKHMSKGTTQTEAQLQEQVAGYLCKQYPDVLFHSDFGSGAKLTPGQAAKQRRQNGGRRAWPDMFIASPGEERYQVEFEDIDKVKPIDGVTAPLPDRVDRIVDGETTVYYHRPGLFLELKREGERLHPGPKAKKRFLSIDGKEYRTDHFKEQADTLRKLRERGYAAKFAVGLDEAKKIIDDYLGGLNG